MRCPPIEILHLAFAHYPANPRVKREAEAVCALGPRVAVIALRDEGQRAVERCGGVLAIRVPGRKRRAGFFGSLGAYVAFVWRCRRLVARHRRLRRLRVVHIHTLPDFLLWAALPARHRGGGGGGRRGGARHAIPPPPPPARRRETPAPPRSAGGG